MIRQYSNLLIDGRHGRPVMTDVLFREDHLPKTIVIFVHGFKGFKDWGHFNALAKHFADEGFIFIKFNMSHNGVTPADPLSFTDLEAFGLNNYGKELDDLQSVIDWSLGDDLLSGERNGEVALIGHSRGGGISILKSAEEPRITKLATWASVSDFLNRNKKRTIETWQRDGVVYTTNARTQQKMPLYYQFYEDLVNNAARYDIHRAAKSLQIPVLVVHGTADEAVPPEEAKQLRQLIPHSQLLLVEGAGHTFEVRHPFVGGGFPANAELVIFKTVEFLRS